MNISLTGMQQAVFALPPEGHIVVLGTAGSGKTTVAMMRAIHIANMPSSGKVLLVTFNKALVKYMRNICNFSSSNLVVENYHKFARGYLNSLGKMPTRDGIALSDQKEAYIKEAVEYLKSEYPLESTFKRPLKFFIDEITFIEEFGFSDYEHYKGAERIGRASANIKRENRKWIYKAFEKYKEIRKKNGRKYDWEDLAFYVFNELKKDSRSRQYKHIIVDEGQDFSPMMIKSLVAAVAKDGSFTFFGDVAQQIYGSRLSWRDSGISISKIWHFDKNYRNTIEIANFAKSITNSQYWRHESDMIESSCQVAKGPKPILIEFSNGMGEIEWVVKRAIEIGKTFSTVIICRNRADIDILLSEFEQLGCRAIEIDGNTPGFADLKEVYLTTYHTAKGLEFDNVIIPFLSKDRFPDPDEVSNGYSEEDVYADEIKLLYVGVTRSKYGLYMTYCGELSPLFPDDSSTYVFKTF